MKNAFRLHNSIVKFDFEDSNQTLEYVLPDGEFGTEPIFIPGDPTNANATEDDGYIVVNTIDGAAEKSNILILRAQNMKPEFKAQAPERGLVGLHSGFFKFEAGCYSGQDTCKPQTSGASLLLQSSFLFWTLSGLIISAFFRP